MKKVIIIFLFLICIPYNVQAIDKEPLDVGNDKEIQELYDYIYNMKTESEVLKDMNLRNYIKNYMEKKGGGFPVKKFMSAVLSYFLKETAASMKLMTLIIIVSIVCSLLSNLEKAFSNENLSNMAYFACFGVIIILMAKSFYSGAQIAKTTINSMTDFMTALIPILMTLLVSIGGFAEAAFIDPVIIGIINIISRLYVNFIIPLIFMAFAMQFASSISKDYKIDKLTKLINQIALWSQGILMTMFIGVITVRGIASKTIDQVTAKTAKYAVDNFVPIVGKCLSDAIGTVAGYSVLLKNAVSSLGLIVILIIIIFPLIKILIMVFMYKLVAALIEPISDTRLVDSINSAGDSMILIMSCLISVSVMFFVMICIVAAAGKMAVGG